MCARPTRSGNQNADTANQFVSNPKRDAAAAIAGFVYQVDVTILRWLNLQQGELLELERGEDLDTVEVEGNEPSGLRILEQVKRRAAPLTLRSEDALTALANYCEHRAVNPGVRLRFKFVTTSYLGNEKNWVLGGSAIEFWQSLRTSERNDSEFFAAVAVMRKFLATCEKPAKLNKATWDYLERVLANDNNEDLIELIQSFEWSTKTGDHSTIEEEIMRGLVRSGYVADRDAALGQFERLFLYVFKRLCMKGLKRLTVEDLSEQLKRSVLNVAEQAALEVIRDVRGRILRLEDAISEDRSLIDSLASQVGDLADTYGARIEYGGFGTSLDAPALVEPLISRPDISTGIMRELGAKTWVSMIGEPGSGKTQLCLLATRLIDSRTVWVNLRGYPQDQSWTVINATLAAASGVNFHPVLRKWYSEVTSSLGTGTVIVIDDLPRVIPASPLERRLEMFLNSCNDRGIRIISTTYYELPNGLSSSGVIGQVRAPRLTDSEIVSLLSAFGAPASILSNTKFCGFLSVTTGGLPVLAAAVAKFLQSKNWKLDSDSFSSVMTSSFAKGIKQDARPLLETTVSQSDSRELLYRLSLVVGPISEQHVEAVSKVSLPIRLGLERLTELVGVWIQPYRSKTYLMSPMVDKSVATSLDATTRKGVHASLGSLILKRKTLGPLDVVTCVHHFQQAEMFNQAAIVLIQALISLAKLSTDVADSSIISEIWASESLREEIDINARLHLRVAQIRLADEKHTEPAFLINDIDRLLEKARDDQNAQIGVFSAAAFLAIRYAREKSYLGNKYLLMALNSLPRAVLPDGTRITVPESMALESLFWATAFATNSDEDVQDWLETIERLAPVQFENLIAWEVDCNGAVVFCDSIYLREYRKEEPNRNWESAQATIRKIENAGQKLTFGLLRVAALRTRIVVLAECLGKLDAAQALAEDEINECENDRERFLIAEVIGRQLAYAKRWVEARTWMERAVSLEIGVYGFLRRNLLITLGEAVAHSAPTEAPEYTRKAVDVAKATGLSKLRIAETLGEHTVALWFAGKRLDAFVAWQEAIQLLLASREERPTWIQSFLAFHHAAGYFAGFALFGALAEPNYAPVSPRMFLATDSIPVELYKPLMESLVYVRTAMFGEGLGDTESAGVWARKGLYDTGQSGADLLPVCAWLLIAPSILRGDYESAVKAAFAKSNGPKVEALALTEFGYQPKDPERWAEVMSKRPWLQQSLLFGIVPMAFRIASLRFSRDVRVDVDLASVALDRIDEKNEDWKVAASEIRLIFSGEKSAESFRADGQRFYSENRLALGVLCFLGMLLRSSIPQSLGLQIRLAADLEHPFRNCPSIRHHVLLPFFVEFWADAINSRSEAFRTAPTYTRRRYDEALSSPDNTRLRKLLDAMTFCIGLSVSDDLRRWLDSAE
ncbi:MAG TPA: hypothetical protein VIH72_14730 [Candidatus Acidoferrales bacterium]